MFKTFTMFLVVLLIGCALAAPAPEPKPHIFAAAAPITPLTYSAYASPLVVPNYVSPYAYRGLGYDYSPFGYAASPFAFL